MSFYLKQSEAFLKEGKKYDDGKVQYTLIPPRALREVAEVLTYGAVKYSPYNWVGVASTRYLAATYRHLEQFRLGNKHDLESGLNHLAHAITSLLFLLERDLSHSDIYGEPFTAFDEEIKSSQE